MRILREEEFKGKKIILIKSETSSCDGCIGFGKKDVCQELPFCCDKINGIWKHEIEEKGNE